MKPSEIQIVGPGGRPRDGGMCGRVRRIIESFDGEEFKAIHIVSVLRTSDDPLVKARGEDAISSTVRHELRRHVTSRALQVIEPPGYGRGNLRTPGIYKQVGELE